jgi:hypothetical protein
MNLCKLIQIPVMSSPSDPNMYAVQGLVLTAMMIWQELHSPPCLIRSFPFVINSSRGGHRNFRTKFVCCFDLCRNLFGFHYHYKRALFLQKLHQNILKGTILWPTDPWNSVIKIFWHILDKFTDRDIIFYQNAPKVYNLKIREGIL